MVRFRVLGLGGYGFRVIVSVRVRVTKLYLAV